MKTEVYERLALDFYQVGHRYHDYLFHGLQEEVEEFVNNENDENYCEELGDILWYVTILAHNKGLTLEDLMWHNYNKLEMRLLGGK